MKGAEANVQGLEVLMQDFPMVGKSRARMQVGQVLLEAQEG